MNLLGDLMGGAFKQEASTNKTAVVTHETQPENKSLFDKMMKKKVGDEK